MTHVSCVPHDMYVCTMYVRIIVLLCRTVSVVTTRYLWFDIWCFDVEPSKASLQRTALSPAPFLVLLVLLVQFCRHTIPLARLIRFPLGFRPGVLGQTSVRLGIYVAERSAQMLLAHDKARVFGESVVIAAQAGAANHDTVHLAAAATCDDQKALRCRARALRAKVHP